MANLENDVRTYAQMLQDGLDEVAASEPFRRFLRFLANNPNYSPRNVLLILQQKPEATRTKGFKGWLKEGRCVREGQRGIRINANFQKGDEDDPISPEPRKKKQDKRTFRRISVFDISQTVLLDDAEDNVQINPAPGFNPANPFEAEMLEGRVEHYDLALQLLRQIAPLPVVFRSDIRTEGTVRDSEIIIKSGMSQLHTIRTVINQMVQIWRRPFCADSEQLEIEAESVAFIVCRHLGLDTSDFSFPHIAQYSFGQERKHLEQFLDAIQQTALYLIDSIDGLLEARQIGYNEKEYFLITNRKTVMRLFREQQPVYLVFPGEGELLTMSKKAIEEHKGPFATDRASWFTMMRKAA